MGNNFNDHLYSTARGALPAKTDLDYVVKLSSLRQFSRGRGGRWGKVDGTGPAGLKGGNREGELKPELGRNKLYGEIWFLHPNGDRGIYADQDRRFRVSADQDHAAAGQSAAIEQSAGYKADCDVGAALAFT